MRSLAMAALAVLTVAGAMTATTSGAEARGWRGHHHGGHHHGGFYRGPGFGIGAGLALGAVGGAYYGGCIRNRVVGYTPHGRPIVRRVCY